MPKGIYIRTQEHNRKLGDRTRGKTLIELYGEERAEKLKKLRSEFQKGKTAWNKNITMSLEARQNMSRAWERRRLIPVSEESKNRNRESQKKRLQENPISEDIRVKRSESNKKRYRDNPETYCMRGKHHSEETKRKIGASHKGKIVSDITRQKLRLLSMFQPHKYKATKIELIIQNLINSFDISFEANKTILGRPDIFIEPNICIFADGCYYHCCPLCGFDKRNLEFTKRKNDRDRYVTEELRKQGYLVLRFWEHEIKNDIGEVKKRILEAVPLRVAIAA